MLVWSMCLCAAGWCDLCVGVVCVMKVGGGVCVGVVCAAGWCGLCVGVVCVLQDGVVCVLVLCVCCRLVWSVCWCCVCAAGCVWSVCWCCVCAAGCVCCRLCVLQVGVVCVLVLCDRRRTRSLNSVHPLLLSWCITPTQTVCLIRDGAGMG